ncbi:amidohydrolase [Actinacidiphila sp. ITFR-21]|uniref:amidohydrolase n=1 Tax=Actinacidiphila sp. ITFR-21 TaxID=3075199 RepID=UPI002889F52D|nr:amidohydrolase [Streptomyces sp. ITFR-21]WNI15390.1 amidohydrolase [Streptomyces sp. ITFR-21]
MPGDLLLANATVIALDPDVPPTANAIGIRRGRIAWVGDVKDAPHAFGGNHREVDLGGATVVPGFNDAHQHVITLGYWMSQIDCRHPAVRSIAELTRAVAERAAATEPGQWVLGRGYDDNNLHEHRHPTRQDLDAVSPHHPVMIRNVSGHMSVANSVALRQAGITRHTPSPFGGHIATDADGEPTGLLQEKAQDLLGVPFLPQDKSLLREYLRVGGRACLAAGITSGQEAGIFSPPEFSVFQEAWADETLALRTYMMIRTPFLEALEGLGLFTGFGDDRLRVGSIKAISDGSLIGRTAAVCHPYEDALRESSAVGDAPADNELGLAMFTQDELDDIVWRGHSNGWQMAIHAIGDRAIDMCLDAYESALRRAPRPDHRHRIEHCGVMRQDIIERMARMGVIPVSQPPFIAEFGDGFLRHLGPERCRLTYPLGSLLRAGIPVAGSSDSPVSSYQPLIGIQAAVTELTANGDPFAPAEALTFDEALALYTRNAAHASFDEKKKGSVTVGKYADLTVLRDDPRTVPATTISQIGVAATILGGEIVHEATTTAPC